MGGMLWDLKLNIQMEIIIINLINFGLKQSFGSEGPEREHARVPSFFITDLIPKTQNVTE